MTPELANIALQFLARVDLKGSEAQAMSAVQQSLKNLVKNEEPHKFDFETEK